MKREIFVCNCEDTDHCLILTYDENDSELVDWPPYFEVNFKTGVPWWRRVWRAFRYNDTHVEVLLDDSTLNELITSLTSLQNRMLEQAYARNIDEEQSTNGDGPVREEQPGPVGGLGED